MTSTATRLKPKRRSTSYEHDEELQGVRHGREKTIVLKIEKDLGLFFFSVCMVVLREGRYLLHIEQRNTFLNILLRKTQEHKRYQR